METEFTAPEHQEQLQLLADTVNRMKAELEKVVVGQEHMIDLIITGILTNGHILLEGVPGVAKTLTAKLMARTLSVGFSRIQFTPDLMPTDLTGTNVYNMKLSEFTFKKGPLFSSIILADEINRAPAKTQAALFEVMEERQLTIDGYTHKMDFPFIVLATQNPIEQEGTYRLPEAQLDRFLFRVKINYPTLSQEKEILRRFREDFNLELANTVGQVINQLQLHQCQNIVRHIHIKDELLDYIAQIVYQTRNNGDLFLGASPRASLAIMKASKAYAGIQGRNFVTPDDIQTMAYPVLNHRIILTPEKEMENMQAEDVIKQIINSIEVPR